MNIDKQKYQNLFLAIILSILSVSVLGFIIIVGLILNISFELANSVGVIISFVVFPYFYVKWIPELNVVRENVFSIIKFEIFFYLLLSLFFCLLMIFNTKYTLYEYLTINIYYLTISITEEYLYRGVIFHILKYRYNVVFSVIMQALLFSLLLHSGLPFALNVLVRIPSGIILGLVTYKTGVLCYSILIHYVYNVLITLFF